MYVYTCLLHCLTRKCSDGQDSQPAHSSQIGTDSRKLLNAALQQTLSSRKLHVGRVLCTRMLLVLADLVAVTSQTASVNGSLVKS